MLRVKKKVIYCSKENKLRGKCVCVCVCVCVCIMCEINKKITKAKQKLKRLQALAGKKRVPRLAIWDHVKKNNLVFHPGGNGLAGRSSALFRKLMGELHDHLRVHKKKSWTEYKKV